MIGFKSIADERLDFALACVQKVIGQAEASLSEEERKQTPAARKDLKKGTPSELAKNYHQYIKSFGMLVLNSGLVAALLFAQGKANKGDKKAEAYNLIIEHLTKWLRCSGYLEKVDDECENIQNVQDREKEAQKAKNSIQQLYSKDSPHIRQATREALAFLQDLKRVADARLQKPEKTGNDGK